MIIIVSSHIKNAALNCNEKKILLQIYYYILDLTVHCGASLNYEALTAYNYTIYVAVSDGIFSDASYLTISVLDENEPPSFNLDTYYVSVDERQV